VQHLKPFYKLEVNRIIFEPVPVHVSIWNMGRLCFACFENPFLF
jgi:hypothetical protein